MLQFLCNERSFGVDSGIAVVQQYGNGAELLVVTVKRQVVEVGSVHTGDLIEIPEFFSPGVDRDPKASGFDGVKECFDVLSLDDDAANKMVLSWENRFFRWRMCHASRPLGAAGAVQSFFFFIFPRLRAFRLIPPSRFSERADPLPERLGFVMKK